MSRTPGPWHVELGAFVYPARGRYKVADAGFAPTKPERDANAYLIAAAPDLLEALQLLVAAQKHVLETASAGDDEYFAAMDAAEAALKKAKGAP